MCAKICAEIQVDLFIYMREYNVQFIQTVVIFVAGKVIFANSNRNMRKTGGNTSRNIYLDIFIYIFG